MKKMILILLASVLVISILAAVISLITVKTNDADVEKQPLIINKIKIDNIILNDYNLTSLEDAGILIKDIEIQKQLSSGKKLEIKDIYCEFPNGDSFKLSVFKNSEDEEYKIKSLDLNADSLQKTNIEIYNIHIGYGEAIDIIDNFKDNFTIIKPANKSNNMQGVISHVHDDYTATYFLNDGIVYAANLANNKDLSKTELEYNAEEKYEKLLDN